MTPTARPDDTTGWHELPAHLHQYERDRARRLTGEHEVRVEDRTDLDDPSPAP